MAETRIQSSSLRKWLMKEPQPSRCRAEYDDGDRYVKIGQARSRWRDAESALETALRIEALDSEGNILRVWDDGQEAALSATPTTRQGNSRETMVELHQLASLLLQAADQGAARHAEAYRLAYDQQCALVTLLVDRLRMVEKAWHSLLMSQQGTIDEADPNAQMIGTLLGAAAPGLLSALPNLLSPATQKKESAPNGA